MTRSAGACAGLQPERLRKKREGTGFSLLRLLARKASTSQMTPPQAIIHARHHPAGRLAVTAASRRLQNNPTSGYQGNSLACSASQQGAVARNSIDQVLQVIHQARVHGSRCRRPWAYWQNPVTTEVNEQRHGASRTVT